MGIRPAIHGMTEGVEHVGDDVYCFAIAMANEDYLRKVLNIWIKYSQIEDVHLCFTHNYIHMCLEMLLSNFWWTIHPQKLHKKKWMFSTWRHSGSPASQRGASRFPGGAITDGHNGFMVLVY